MNQWKLTWRNNKVETCLLEPVSFKFAKSDYWYCWSRNIGKHSRIDITPIPNCFSSTWEEVKEGKFFSQRFDGKDDIQCDTLPLEVHQMMVENLGSELAAKLICYDYLQDFFEEDIEKACSIKSGGVSFLDLKEIAERPL